MNIPNLLCPFGIKSLPVKTLQSCSSAHPQKTICIKSNIINQVRSTSQWRLNVAIGIQATIVFIAALYLARAFFVPLLIGILASYTLSPLVDWLKKYHLPRAAGAALVLVFRVSGTLL